MSKDKTDAPQPSTSLMRLDPQALLQSAVENGAGIETLERLVSLAKDVRAQQAKEAWHRAISQFQEECPKILKARKASISTRGGGSYSYHFASLSDLMSTISPVMGPLGLSVSFRMRYADGQVVATCLVAHEMGHSESSGEVAMPYDKGDGTGANPAQRVGIASTYAKRYALLAILGIAPEDDTDGQDAPKRDPSVSMPRRSSEAPQSQPPDEPGSNDGPAAPAERLITDGQRKRLWAIAFGAGKNLDLSKTDVNDRVKAIVGRYGFDSTDYVTSAKYDSIIKEIEEWGAGG